ncbi:MAG TPA: ABC transporter permease, partial [Streptosporangiaceae bacterium]
MAARLPAAVRRTAGHRLALTATAVTVLVASVLAAAAAAFTGEVTSAAVRRSLTQNPGSTILVTEQVPAAGAAAAGRQVEQAVHRVLPGLPVAVTGSLRSQILDLPLPGRPRGGPPRAGSSPAGPSQASSPQAGSPHRGRPSGAGGVIPQTQIISLPGVARRAVLTGGSWPGPAVPAGGPVPVAVPVAVARLLRLAPGDRLLLRNNQIGAKVPVRITGVFRPADPASPYWRLSPLGGGGVQRSAGFAVYGPLVTSPAVAAGPAVPVTSAAWLAVPDFAALGAGRLTALDQRLASGLGGNDVSNGGLAGLPQATVTTSLPALLGQLSTALLVARSQLLIGVLILLAVIGGAVAVSVRPLAAQREPEAALLAARGASRRQLAARGATQAVLLAAPAAIIGPWLGSRLGVLVARIGPLAHAGLVPAGTGPDVTGGVPASAWLAGLAVAAGCAVIMALPWLRRPQSALRVRVAAGRQRPVTGVVMAGADLALVVLAVLAGWQLAHYQAPVSAGLDGALGVDPLLAAAPVLALTAGTVVMLRLLPLATRLADAAAARQRGLAVALASWQLSRRPLGRVGPALLAVLAIAAAVIALAQHSSWQRSVADQAGFAVGADERITLPPAAPLALDQVAGLARAHGVTASTPAIRAQIGLPGGQNGTLLALDARATARIVPLRRDLAAMPPARLLAALVPARPAAGVPLPGRPTRLSVTTTLRGA